MEVEPEISQFETSEALAGFLCSTPLLSDSWKLCSSTYAYSLPPGSFIFDQIGDVGYVSFSAVQSVTEMNLNEIQLAPIDIGVFSSLRGEDEDPPMVHAGLLHLFHSVYNNGDFRHKMMRLMEKCKSIICTGHSIGGAVASIAALWLMSVYPRYSVLCITFGAPLLANESLSKAILRERWGGNFINLVSKHDIVPRLLFAPLTTASAQLNGLLQLLPLSIIPSEYRSTQLNSVLSGIENICDFHHHVSHYVHEAATSGHGTTYRPFGSYLFCSAEGTICLDDVTAIVKMLDFTFVDSSAISIIDDHLSYGDTVARISNQFSTKTEFDSVSDSSYEAGISLALYASGLQVCAPEPKKCLMDAAWKKGCPNRNCAKLAISLAKITPHRAQIEWYKASCDDSEDMMGYYDTFKRKRASKKDMSVNMFRTKLAKFWDEVIDMVETNRLPYDFDKRAKWVNASQFYKLLVEPLDIAEYYRSGMQRTKGHYLKHGRERRYEIFDKWWRAREVGAEESYKRNNYAGLTQDSCFWAKVEEASEWLKNVSTIRDPQKFVEIWQNIDNFELYAKRLVDSKEVSKDVVAKNSSYSAWIGELEVLRGQFRQMPPRYDPFLGGGGGMVPS